MHDVTAYWTLWTRDSGSDPGPEDTCRLGSEVSGYHVINISCDSSYHHLLCVTTLQQNLELSEEIFTRYSTPTTYWQELGTSRLWL